MYIQLVRGEASIEPRIPGSVVLNYLCYVATQNDKWEGFGLKFLVPSPLLFLDNKP